MKRKHRFHKARMVRPTLTYTQLPSIVGQKSIWQAVTTIEKLEFDEKIELFQQLEIAQGIRKGEKSARALSTASQKILHKYDALPSEREKNIFANRIKNQVFDSLKKNIAKG